MTISALSNSGMVLLLSPLVGFAISRVFRQLIPAKTTYQCGLIFGSFGVALWAIQCADAPLVVTLVLGWTLLLLACVDIAIFRLPDILTLPLIVVGLGVSLFLHREPTEHLLACCGAYGLFWGIDVLYKYLRGRSGLGLGDAKLFAVAGAWLGWRPLPAVLLLACAGGLVWVVIRLLRHGRASANQPLPFGAPLCAAIWLVWCGLPTWQVGLGL